MPPKPNLVPRAFSPRKRPWERGCPKPLAQVCYPPKSAFLINFERFSFDYRRQLFVKVGLFYVCLLLLSALQVLCSKWCETTQCVLFQPIRAKAKTNHAPWLRSLRQFPALSTSVVFSRAWHKKLIQLPIFDWLPYHQGQEAEEKITQVTAHIPFPLKTEVYTGLFVAFRELDF